MKITSYSVSNISPIVFPTNWGVSDCATFIQEKTEELSQNFIQNVTFGEKISKLIESLIDIENKCSVDNWDGYGAERINNESFQNAIRFVLSLPWNVPIPEVYVDPDGEVTFEWYEGRHQVFSITVGRKKELAFAGHFGATSNYGVEYLYEEIPDTIIRNIYRFFKDDI